MRDIIEEDADTIAEACERWGMATVHALFDREPGDQWPLIMTTLSIAIGLERMGVRQDQWPYTELLSGTEWGAKLAHLIAQSKLPQ